MFVYVLCTLGEKSQEEHKINGRLDERAREREKERERKKKVQTKHKISLFLYFGSDTPLRIGLDMPREENEKKLEKRAPTKIGKYARNVPQRKRRSEKKLERKKPKHINFITFVLEICKKKIVCRMVCRRDGRSFSLRMCVCAWNLFQPITIEYFIFLCVAGFVLAWQTIAFFFVFFLSSLVLVTCISFLLFASLCSATVFIFIYQVSVFFSIQFSFFSLSVAHTRSHTTHKVNSGNSVVNNDTKKSPMEVRALLFFRRALVHIFICESISDRV